MDNKTWAWAFLLVSFTLVFPVYAQSPIQYNVMNGLSVDNGETTYTSLSTAIASSQINLSKGLNLASLPIIPGNGSLPNVFSSINGGYSFVVAYNASKLGSKWLSFSQSKPAFLNTLLKLDEKQGFWINATNNIMVNLTGSEVITSFLYMRKGWNMIGYPTKKVNNVSVVMHFTNNTFTVMYAYNATSGEFLVYNPRLPFSLNTLKRMEPGLGYWVNATENVRWVFFRGTYRI